MGYENIYVHLDSVTNSVLSKGLSYKNYRQAIKKIPTNLLLLDAPKNIGEYESYTGFRIIRGIENVQQFIDEFSKNSASSVKWVDFESLELLRELTPGEIAELLYVGHTYTHLHSPFNYKLQNNYIYLTLPENVTKVYFRYIDQFYFLLADSLNSTLEKKINEKKIFFKKAQSVAPVPNDLMKQISPLLREGALFAFKQMKVNGSLYEIPVFVLEDRIKQADKVIENDALLGVICYDGQKQEWFIKEEKSAQLSL